MEKMNWSVDVEDCYLTEKSEYIVSGWAFDENMDPCSLYVTTEQGAILPSRVDRTYRPDVEKVLAHLPILEAIGFNVTVEGISELKKRGVQTICLKSTFEGQEYLLNERSVDDIIRIGQESSIRMGIDSIQEKNQMFTVVGWIYNVGQKEWCTVKDASGKEYAFEMKRLKRPDIIDHFHLREGFPAGFELTFTEKPQVSDLVISVKNEFCKTEKALQVPVRNFRKNLDKLFKVKEKVTEEQLQAREAHIRRYGEADLAYELRKAQNLALTDYDIYRERHKVSKEELKAQREHVFEYNPKISICIPLFNTPLNFLKELIDSVRQQTYPNWQLCLGDASTKPEPGKFIKKHYSKDKRIVYQVLEENAGISENTNAAVRFSDGEFIMFSDHDDMLEPNALFEIVSRLQDREVDVVYTDEDKMDMDGKLFYEPHFKPDFNLYYLRSCNYITHIFVAKRTIVDEVGLLDPRCDGAQDYDYIFRCCEKANKIMHVPMILYHWRCHPASTAGNPESKMYAYESGVRALQGHYDRLGIAAKASRSQWLGRYLTELEMTETPKVTVIVSQGRFADYTRKCISDIQKISLYKNLEFISICREDQKADYEEVIKGLENRKIVEPGQVRLLSCAPELSQAEQMNQAAELAEGEYLAFIDAQLTPNKENWVKEMLSYCMRSDVGAVGTRILMGQNEIWHAGIVLGLGKDRVGANLLYGERADVFSYQGRGESTLETTAVSSVCMMVSKALFTEMGGMDPTYKEIFMDLDFCLRLKKAGKCVIYNPYAQMRFFGLFDRPVVSGAYMGPAYAEMCTAFSDKWNKEIVQGDPFYNPNLSAVRTDCSVRS